MTGPHRPRTAFIVALLLGTLVLAAVLGLQAWAGVAYHRATAEGVLRDYARAASEEYAARTARALEYYGVYPTFRLLQRAGARGASILPARAALVARADGLERGALAFAQALFRLDLATASLTTSWANVAPDDARWLTDTLPEHARTVFEDDWASAIVVDPFDPRRFIAYTLEHADGDQPAVAVGIMLDVDSVRALFAASATRAPLLPPTLTRRSTSDSLMAVRLLDAAGQIIYASGAPADDSVFVGRALLGARFGGMQAQVLLRPDRAADLIIGGLPKDRLPLIAALLLLTVGMVVAALTLLRHEHELARLRAEFVSNVSHELRTPLAEIRMFAETLALGRVRTSAEHERSIAIIDQEARRLTHLVENVLHLSRADRNAARVSPEPTPLEPLLRHVAEVFTPLAAARNVSLDTAIEPGTAAFADRAAVQQMLLNLLDNAVKYGPQGQRVTLGAAQRNGVTRLWVTDEGPGIPKAERERIWARFSRLDRERDSAVAGTGIGLAVVRELAHLHGGRAWSEAAPGGGSVFVIELPAAESGDES